MEKPKQSNETVSLVDLDGVLADYDGAMQKSLDSLSAPEEKVEETGYHKPHSQHVWARMNLIKESGEWWENLPRFKLGFDVLDILRELDYYISILTQGPKANPVAWSHKVKWCFKNVPDLDITITRNKGLVYGKVLVDDYPEYIQQWLEFRPRGLVIMPAHKYNLNFKHPNAIRYDGTNLDKVRTALEMVKNRKSGEELKLQ
jgi:5'-nucleotidase